VAPAIACAVDEIEIEPTLFDAEPVARTPVVEASVRLLMEGVAEAVFNTPTAVVVVSSPKLLAPVPLTLTVPPLEEVMGSIVEARVP
jgi:hypothetical protein